MWTLIANVLEDVDPHWVLNFACSCGGLGNCWGVLFFFFFFDKLMGKNGICYGTLKCLLSKSFSKLKPKSNSKASTIIFFFFYSISISATLYLFEKQYTPTLLSVLSLFYLNIFSLFFLYSFIPFKYYNFLSI